MDSTGEKLHPNWLALATCHITLKRFVPEGTIEPQQKYAEKTEQLYKLENFKGEQVKKFYEDVLQMENVNKNEQIIKPSAKKLIKPKQIQSAVGFCAKKLFNAAMSNDVATIKSMQYKENDINDQDAFGWTALMMAACENAVAAVECLLSLDADKEIKDKSGRSAADLALKKGNLSVLDLLKKHKPTPKTKTIIENKIGSKLKEVQKDGTFYCETCEQTFTESSRRTHLTSTLHVFCNKSATLLGIMSKSDEQKALEIIQSTEEVADQILANKHAKVQLDKRRQETREAIRMLEKQPVEETKVWITLGSMLVKMKREKALKLLKNDATTIDCEIQKLESEQRILVNKHRDLEHFSPYTGTHLKPLARKEFEAFKANLPGL